MRSRDGIRLRELGGDPGALGGRPLEGGRCEDDEPGVRHVPRARELGHDLHPRLDSQGPLTQGGLQPGDLVGRWPPGSDPPPSAACCPEGAAHQPAQLRGPGEQGEGVLQGDGSVFLERMLSERAAHLGREGALVDGRQAGGLGPTWRTCSDRLQGPPCGGRGAPGNTLETRRLSGGLEPRVVALGEEEIPLGDEARGERLLLPLQDPREVGGAGVRTAGRELGLGVEVQDPDAPRGLTHRGRSVARGARASASRKVVSMPAAARAVR